MCSNNRALIKLINNVYMPDTFNRSTKLEAYLISIMWHVYSFTQLTTTLHIMCVHLPTRHNVLQSQSCRSCECVLTGDVGYIAHSLRWNHVCFQDAVRDDSGLVV